jgi:hypothetical protein
LPKRVIPLFEKEGSGKILNGEGALGFLPSFLPVEDFQRPDFAKAPQAER